MAEAASGLTNKQLVSLWDVRFDAQSNMTLVPRDLCNLPGAAWTRLHKDTLHNRNDTCRRHLGRACFLTVELAWCFRDVRSVSRRTKDARSIATNCVRLLKWDERKYGRDHRSGCCSSMSNAHK